MSVFDLSDGTSVSTVSAENASRAKQFFVEIASEQGWLPPEGAIDGYPLNSVYFLHEVDERVVGAVKLVMGNDNEGLPILEVWSEFGLRGREEAAELSILALTKDARGKGSSFLPLSAEVWRYCALNGVTELWAELEPRMVKIYRRFGWPFEVVGEPREYWGDPLYPCRMSLHESGMMFVEKAVASQEYSEAVVQATRDTPYQF